jgi:hypothetical protein
MSTGADGKSGRLRGRAAIVTGGDSANYDG